MRSRFFIILFFLSTSVGVMAQSTVDRGHPNLRYFEQNQMHFGFTLGFNTANFNIDYDLTGYDSLISIKAKSQAGFNIGLVSSLRLNRYFTLRFTPTLVFAQRDVEYVFASEPKNLNTTKIVESTYIMFPLLFKYRSERLGNFAAYVVGGGNYGFDLSSQVDYNNDVVIEEQLLKINKSTFFAEAGFGVDFFLEYFKFSIELKYSHGLGKAYIDDGSFWAEPINDMKPKMFTVSFHFEG